MVALWENGDQRLGDIAEHTSIAFHPSRLLGTSTQAIYRSPASWQRWPGPEREPDTKKGRAMTERIFPIALHYEEVATRGMQSDQQRLKKMLIKLFGTTVHQEFTVGVKRAENPRPVDSNFRTSSNMALRGGRGTETEPRIGRADKVIEQRHHPPRRRAAVGTKRTFVIAPQLTSAFGGKADIPFCT